MFQFVSLAKETFQLHSKSTKAVNFCSKKENDRINFESLQSLFQKRMHKKSEFFSRSAINMKPQRPSIVYNSSREAQLIHLVAGAITRPDVSMIQAERAWQKLAIAVQHPDAVHSVSEIRCNYTFPSPCAAIGNRDDMRLDSRASYNYGRRRHSSGSLVIQIDSRRFLYCTLCIYITCDIGMNNSIRCARSNRARYVFGKYLSKKTTCLIIDFACMHFCRDRRKTFMEEPARFPGVYPGNNMHLYKLRHLLARKSRELIYRVIVIYARVSLPLGLHAVDELRVV